MTKMGGGGVEMSKPKVGEFLYQNDCDVHVEHFSQRHSTCLTTSFYKKLRLSFPSAAHPLLQQGCHRLEKQIG